MMLIRCSIWVGIRLWCDLNQFQLLGLHRSHPHAFDLAIRGVENFKAQTIFFDDLAFAGNPAGKFADQPGYGSGLFSFRLSSKKLVETVDIHAAGDDEGAIAVAHDLRLIAVIAD